jgi:hypothetical protein
MRSIVPRARGEIIREAAARTGLGQVATEIQMIRRAAADELADVYDETRQILQRIAEVGIELTVRDRRSRRRRVATTACSDGLPTTPPAILSQVVRW